MNNQQILASNFAVINGSVCTEDGARNWDFN